MRAFWTAILLLAACGDDSSTPDASPGDAGADVVLGDTSPFDAASPDGGSVDTGPAPLDVGIDAGSTCPRTIGDPDRDRFLILSHPFATPNDAYSVHRLDVDGELTDTGEEFTMSRAFDGAIAFSADGVIGVIAHDDGTLGIFRVATNGAVTVIESGRRGTAYASSVVADPTDIHVFWVLNSQTLSNDGGIYRLELDCEGAVVSDELAISSDLPYGLDFEASGQALVYARSAGDSTSGDVHRVDLSTGAVSSSAELFEDTDWIGGGFTSSGAHAFAGDASAFSSFPNRVGVASLDGALGFSQRVLDVEDPLAIFVSPFDDKLMVISGFGDAFFVFDYDPAASEPLSGGAELAYSTGRPALPGSAVMIQRGALSGLVLVSENQAVHKVVFQAGNVLDAGRYELGEGLDVIPGAIGVQP